MGLSSSYRRDFPVPGKESPPEINMVSLWSTRADNRDLVEPERAVAVGGGQGRSNMDIYFDKCSSRPPTLFTRDPDQCGRNVQTLPSLHLLILNCSKEL